MPSAPDTPIASILIPTYRGAGYLDVTLASIMPQAVAAGAEVIVIRDGPDPAVDAVTARHGARLLGFERQGGLNRGRNAGIAAARGDLLVFIDQDVRAPEGWLDAWVAGVSRYPELEVFAGPIDATLEHGPRSCGREPPPITHLDAGPEDRDVPWAWGANMAMRRSAFDRIGLFDEGLHGRGNEDEWELRWRAGGGRIRYLAGAGLVHRRDPRDSRLWALTRVAYTIGRESRRADVSAGTPRPARVELRALAGCAWHTVARRCAFGIVMGARCAGSLREMLTPAGRAGSPPPAGPAGPQPAEDFLSGESGMVVGVRATSRAVVADARADLRLALFGQPWRLRRAAHRAPRRSVLVLGIERVGEPNLLAAAAAELTRSRHDVEVMVTEIGGRGKFENLNRLLDRRPALGHDWLIVLDDDVALPPGFLDAFLFLAERVGLRLAQPAHRARSHAAWQVTRRRPGSLVRQTAYVEIGPLVAFHATTFDVLLPFPELRAGWGLDAHWAALARQRSWPVGIVDATAIRHGLRRIAAAYDRGEAIAEGRRYLADRPYLPASDLQRTFVTYRSW